MTATKNDILRWVHEAQDNGCRWLIIAVDTFDYENYPIFVMEDEDFWERYPDYNNMQRADEVYDMKMDIDAQLAERRANHPPARK